MRASEALFACLRFICRIVRWSLLAQKTVGTHGNCWLITASPAGRRLRAGITGVAQMLCIRRKTLDAGATWEPVNGLRVTEAYFLGIRR